MVIDTPWTQLPGVADSDIEAWQWVVVLAAVPVLVGPIVWWKERLVTRWQCWRSVGFFIGYLCVLVPLSFVVGGVVGDTHAQADADLVVARLVSALPDGISSVSAVSVEPSEHSTYTTVHLPYKGRELHYSVEFTAATAAGLVQCQGGLFLARQSAPRNVSGAAYARLSGYCPESRIPLPFPQYVPGYARTSEARVLEIGSAARDRRCVRAGPTSLRFCPAPWPARVVRFDLRKPRITAV